MWQRADGVGKKRFTLWLLAVSSSWLHINWHTHTYTDFAVTARTAPLTVFQPVGVSSVFFVHGCWAWLHVYQPMSSTYCTQQQTNTILLEGGKERSGGREKMCLVTYQVCTVYTKRTKTQSNCRIKHKRERRGERNVETERVVNRDADSEFILEELNMNTDGGQRRDGLLLLNLTAWNTGSALFSGIVSQLSKTTKCLSYQIRHFNLQEPRYDWIVNWHRQTHTKNDSSNRKIAKWHLREDCNVIKQKEWLMAKIYDLFLSLSFH